MIIGAKPASVNVSALLSDLTAKAAIAFAAGKTFDNAVAASITTLGALEVLGDMLAYKMRLAFLAFLVLSAVATGAGTHRIVVGGSR